MTDSKKPLLTFPCDFQIKVFGLANEEFEIAVLTILRANLESIAENAIRSRPSKDGKYIAMTVTVDVKSQEQLDNIYKALSADPNILMAL